jgi:hypothetical protein
VSIRGLQKFLTSHLVGGTAIACERVAQFGKQPMEAARRITIR